MPQGAQVPEKPDLATKARHWQRDNTMLFRQPGHVRFVRTGGANREERRIAGAHARRQQHGIPCGTTDVQACDRAEDANPFAGRLRPSIMAVDHRLIYP